jgi:hypothetical protein
MSTTDRRQEYLVIKETYSTAEIQRIRFSGETPDPYAFQTYRAPHSEEARVYRIIDGEARIISDEPPPGASPANFDQFL